MILNISVARSSKENVARFMTYEVPFTKGMTVLDAIFYIQQRLDSTLAFRYECRQGICGTCGVMLNKKPVLACSTQLLSTKKEQTIEPLANFPIEKDLIVNLEPILTQYMKVRPYLDRYTDMVITRDIANKSKPFRKCIECGCCIAGSSTVKKMGDAVIDPMSLVKIARYITDPREGLKRVPMAKARGVAAYTAKEGKDLADLCPRGVPIDQAIKIVK